MVYQASINIVDKRKPLFFHVFTVVIFVFIILVRFHFFYLFTYPSSFFVFEGFYGWIVIFFLCLLLYFAAIFTRHGKEDRAFVFLKFFPWIVFVSYFFVAFCTILEYREQPVYQSIGKEFNILNIFLALPLYRLTKESKQRFIVFDVCNVCLGIYCALVLLQSFIFSASSRLILGFSDVFTTDYVFTRTFGIRISANNIIPFTVLYCFWRLIAKGITLKQMFAFLFFFVVQFLALLVVIQTRIITIGVLVGLALILLVGPITKGKITAFLITSFIVLLVALLTNYFSILIDSLFNRSNHASYSFYVRLDSMAYYLHCFSKNIFFGNGFAVEKYYFHIEHGPDGTAYYSDTGFIGLLGEMGIQAFLVFFLPFLFTLKVTGRSLSLRRTGYSFWLGLFVTLLILSICLPMYNHLEWPVLLALFAHEYSEIERTKFFALKKKTPSPVLTVG